MHCGFGALIFSLALLVNGASASSSCNQGTVTCCFTVERAFLQLFVNEQEITSQVLPGDINSAYNIAVTKTVTFTEPTVQSVIAFKGLNTNEVNFEKGFSLACVSTNPNSPWNFVSATNADWKSVISLSYYDDIFPDQWYSINYNGSIISVTVDTKLQFALDVNAGCGAAINNADHLRVGPMYRPYFTFRKVVDGTCGTFGPTVSPTNPTMVTS